MRSLEIITEKVLIHGKSYVPAIVPSEITRGRVGDCFDWTLVQALIHYPKYKYVEGIAKRPSNGEWVLHAWLSDGVHAFDLTWGAYFGKSREEAIKNNRVLPCPTEYIGIAMDAKDVADFYRAVEYKSVLHNGWRDEQRSEKLLGFNFK